MRFAVTENGVEFIELGVYVHPSEAHITDVYPLSGPVEGGTLVSVLGSGFLVEHPPFCQFGDFMEVEAKVKYYIHYYIFNLTLFSFSFSFIYLEMSIRT